MRIVLLAAALFCSAFVGACISATGRLEQNRFQHEIYPYALFYPPNGRAESPLGPHYTLENFRSPDGQHRYQKAGDGYTIERSYATDTPPSVQRELFYDLLFSRDTPQAAFWIRTVPLPEAERDRPLAELAQHYLDNVARLGRVAVPLGVEAAPSSNTRVQLRETGRVPCELSKREALRLDFEVENTRAVRSLNAPDWKAGTVVLIRSGYLARGKYPVLMLVGRSSAVKDTALLESDYDRLLQQLVLGDKGQGLSMKGGHSCHLGGAATAPEEPVESATPPESSGGEHAPTPELEVPTIQEDAPGAIENPEQPLPPSGT